MKLKLFKGEPISRSWHSENGFTMFELMIILIIMAVIITAGTLSYASISRSVRLSGAMNQIEAALSRAKLAARQENVKYKVVFYSSTDGGNPDTYEFLHNVAVVNPGDPLNLTWSMTPVDKSVPGESVTAASNHWYIKVPNGVDISGSQITVFFSPAGTAMSTTWEPAGGDHVAIDLRSGSGIGSVSIDAQGNIKAD